MTQVNFAVPFGQRQILFRYLLGRDVPYFLRNPLWRSGVEIPERLRSLNLVDLSGRTSYVVLRVKGASRGGQLVEKRTVIKEMFY